MATAADFAVKNTAFEKLSREGKLKKIQMHIDGNWPVPASWVRWILDDYMPEELADSAADAIREAEERE